MTRVFETVTQIGKHVAREGLFTYTRTPEWRVNAFVGSCGWKSLRISSKSKPLVGSRKAIHLKPCPALSPSAMLQRILRIHCNHPWLQYANSDPLQSNSIFYEPAPKSILFNLVEVRKFTILFYFVSDLLVKNHVAANFGSLEVRKQTNAIWTI